MTSPEPTIDITFSGVPVRDAPVALARRWARRLHRLRARSDERVSVFLERPRGENVCAAFVLIGDEPPARARDRDELVALDQAFEALAARRPPTATDAVS